MNVVDFGMNVQDAVDCAALPPPVDAGRAAMERGFSPDTIALLKTRGHTVEDRVRRAWAKWPPSGSMTAGSKARPIARSEGTAEGY